MTKIFNPKPAFNTSFLRIKVKVPHGVGSFPKLTAEYLLKNFDFLKGKEPKKESE